MLGTMPGTQERLTVLAAIAPVTSSISFKREPSIAQPTSPREEKQQSESFLKPKERGTDSFHVLILLD